MEENSAYDPSPKERVAAICPQVAAIISMIGSYIIIREVIVDHKQKRGKAIPRILFELCISDFIFSFGWLLGTWPTPKDTPNRWGNYGNTVTCDVQGFLLNFGLLASPLFNICLAFFSYLMVCWNWHDAKLKQLEPWVHGSIWVFSLVCAIFPIPLGLYNNAWTVCWFESIPAGCKDSFRYGDEANCTRGDNAWVYAVVFTIFPVVTCVFLSFVLMGLIFAYVHKTERRACTAAKPSLILRRSANPTTSCDSAQTADFGRKNSMSELPRSDRWRGYKSSTSSLTSNTSNESNRPNSSIRSSNTTSRRTRSRTVAVQGLFYGLSFVATYALHCICTLIFFITGKSWYWLSFTMYFFLSLQGFFNCLVFIRNRKMKTPEGIWAQRILCLKGNLRAAKKEKKSSRTQRASVHTSQALDAIEEAPSNPDDLMVEAPSQVLRFSEESHRHLDDFDDTPKDEEDKQPSMEKTSERLDMMKETPSSSDDLAGAASQAVAIEDSSSLLDDFYYLPEETVDSLPNDYEFHYLPEETVDSLPNDYVGLSGIESSNAEGEDASPPDVVEGESDGMKSPKANEEDIDGSPPVDTKNTTFPLQSVADDQSHTSKTSFYTAANTDFVVHC